MLRKNVAGTLNTTSSWAGRLLLLLYPIVLVACGSRPYHGAEVNLADFLARSISQDNNKLVVHAAVPDAAETAALTGLDLYGQGIQPIWLKVENRGASRARIATWSIDRDYFSPIEVAYMNRGSFSKTAYADMQRWFYNNGLPRYIPAGETRSGLVFTHLKSGTKGFNLDIFRDQTAHSFTFFVPLPGFTADFMEVKFDKLYSESEVRKLSTGELRMVLEQELSCCATDPTGEQEGIPFNAVLVGTGLALRRSMLRGGWLETAAGDDAGRLVVERSRKQSYRGRPPDAIFTQSREDGNEKIYLQLWLAPWLVDSDPVWLGQVFYWSEDNSPFAALMDADEKNYLQFQAFFVRESAAADLDSAQSYLFQDFWYSGSLRKVGYVSGVGKATLDEPLISFGGNAYFTEGLRVVVFLSETPVALDEGEFLYLLKGAVSAGGLSR